MIYFADASGAVARCVPERVFQGSAEGIRIYLVAPFAQSETISASFRLPSGASTRPYLLNFEGTLDGVTDGQGMQMYGWSLLLPTAVTADFGTVTVQFYCNASGVATSAVQFTVERGVRRELPEAPSDEAYTEIVEAVAAISSDLHSGYYAARAMYAYNSARTYGANELAFVADAGERGAIVRSLRENNDTAPYDAEGTLAADSWSEAVRFDNLYTVEENASAYASSAAAMAETARQSAENAQNAASSVQGNASSAQINAEAASASASSASESASAAQTSASSAQESARLAQEALSKVEEITGGDYVTQSAFADVISGKQKVGAALEADSATKADTAVNAETAARADTATHAETSTSAETAESAQSAVSAQSAQTATAAGNVTTSIAGKQIASIFESDGITVKSATKASDDGQGNEIASTYVKKTDLLDLVYPIGTIVYNYDTGGSSPASVLGGSWTRIYDKFLIGAGSNYTVGTEGGEEFHQLTTAEIPSHDHSTGVRMKWVDAATSNALTHAWASSTGNLAILTNPQPYTSSVGDDTPHNNMPPYRAVWMWRRTA